MNHYNFKILAANSKFFMVLSFISAFATTSSFGAPKQTDLQNEARNELVVPSSGKPSRTSPSKSKTSRSSDSFGATFKPGTNSKTGVNTETNEKQDLENTKPYLVATPNLLPQMEQSRAWTIAIGIENLAPQGKLKAAGLDPIDLASFDENAAVLLRLSWWAFKSRHLDVSLFGEISWQTRKYELKLPGLGTIHQANLDLIRPQISALLLSPIKTWNKFYTLSGGASIAAGKFIQAQSSASSGLLNVSNNLSYWEIGPHLEFKIGQSFFVDLSATTRTALNSEYERTYHGLLAAGIPF